MKLFLMLFGFVCLNAGIILGIIIAIHFDFTLGLLIAGTFTVKWFFMFPQMEGRNE